SNFCMSYALIEGIETVAYVFGGVNGTVESTIERVNLTAKTSTVVGNMIAPRYDFTLTEVPQVIPGSRRFLIAGGVDPASGVPLNSAEIFDTATKTSTLVGPMVKSRYGHTATVTPLPTGTVLICGGCDEPSAELFNPGTGTFTEVPMPMCAARRFHTATVVPYSIYNPATGRNDSLSKVLLAGGATDGSAELFDFTTNTFTRVQGNMIHPRQHHAARTAHNIAVDVQIDGKIFKNYYPQVVLAGGSNGVIHGDAEIFNGYTDSFQSAGNLAVPRAQCAMLLFPFSMMLIGGLTPAVGGGVEATGTIEVLNLLPSGQIETLPVEPGTPRYAHCAVGGPDGVYIVGGRTIGAAGATPVGSIEVLQTGGQQYQQGSFDGQASVTVTTVSNGNAVSPSYTLSAQAGTNAIGATVVGGAVPSVTFAATSVYVPSAVSKFRISLPNQSAAQVIYGELGKDLLLEITALDSNDAVVNSFTGNVNISTSAPGTTTFDNKVVTFTPANQGKALVTGNILTYPGSKDSFVLTASLSTNPLIKGQATVYVFGPVAGYALFGPISVNVGETFVLTARALDERGSLVQNYSGQGRISTSLPGTIDLDGADMIFVVGTASITGHALAGLLPGYQ
ncbi:MAG: kelch repeat-containing protein, partial [Planctomycetota bacterium]|nr:kelch repeat-containing protein [Planctomycetota bacterium]